MAERQPAVAEPKKEVTQLSGRVLLVEDNDVNRLVACRMLEHLGLEVATAGDGAGAGSFGAGGLRRPGKCLAPG